MKNDRPMLLIERLRSLCRIENGIVIRGKLIGRRPEHMIEFLAFRTFVEETRKKLGLVASGEFYYNYEESGFTGISRFESGHLTITAIPDKDFINLEIFLSHHIPGNIVLAREFYHLCLEFFYAEIIEDRYADV